MNGFASSLKSYLLYKMPLAFIHTNHQTFCRCTGTARAPHKVLDVARFQVYQRLTFVALDGIQNQGPYREVYTLS